MMKGWKTWCAVVFVAVSAGLEAAGWGEYAKVVATVGGAFGLMGIGHKIERVGENKN